MHETFYAPDGKPVGWTESETAPYGETAEELIWSLEQMLSDAKRCKDDILDYDMAPAEDIEGEENGDNDY
jgi:hypothetical protein